MTIRLLLDVVIPLMIVLLAVLVGKETDELMAGLDSSAKIKIKILLAGTGLLAGVASVANLAAW